MTIDPLAAGAIALAGNFALSLGMILQKRNVAWLDRASGGGAFRDPAFRRALALWSAGFVLMNLVPAFQYFSLMGLSTNVVSAATGSSVAFTVLLSRAFLRERIGAGRLALTGLMLLAIALAGLRGSALATEVEAPFLFGSLALPLIAATLALALRARRRGPRVAVFLAAVSGSLGGFMILPLRALQLEAGTLSLVLASPYLYAFIAAALASFALIQLAYKDGEMSSVSPALYGMQVLWPAFASYFAFRAPVDALQAAALAAIVACVAALAAKAR